MARTPFTDAQPERDFYWVFVNRDGTEDARLVPISDYRTFVALHGIPATGWRYAKGSST